MAKQMIAQGQKPCITVITVKNPTERKNTQPGSWFII